MNYGEAMEPKVKQESNEKQDANVSSFVKVGIVVLSIIMIIGFGIKVLPSAITVTNISSKRDLPIYCVNTEEKEVALSFDTAWGNEDINKILDILSEYNVKGTFFVTGEFVNNYPEDVKAIVAAGHDLGNHSENHIQMSQLTREQCTDEIMKAHNRVKELTGIEMNLFRPPYGDYNNTLMQVSRECGYYTIQWDINSMDWKDYGTDNIINTVVNNKHLDNGSIILLHNGAKYLPDALGTIIISLRNKGYDLVPISKLIYTGDYVVDHTGRQFEK